MLLKSFPFTQIPVFLRQFPAQVHAGTRSEQMTETDEGGGRDTGGGAASWLTVTFWGIRTLAEKLLLRIITQLHSVCCDVLD